MTGWMTKQGPVWAWLSRRNIRQLVLGAGALVLLASGLFGGLREAQADPRATLKADTAHAATPFEITITKVSSATDLGESFEPTRLGRFLVVFATIRTNQDQSVHSFVVREALRMRGLSGFAKNELNTELVPSDAADPRVVVATDRVPLGDIGPGLTYEVAFIWEQDAAQPLPASVELESYVHGFRRSSLDDQEDWFVSSPDATGRFAVEKLGAN